jgi:glucosyl-dolichyl phosphate glucuronosyltransferase
MVSVLQQSLVPAKYEIVVIDNGSFDTTPLICRDFRQAYPAHTVRAFHEKQVGLASARNRGLLEARGEFVAYLDDDAKADANWLERAVELLMTVEPSPAVVGGPIKPFYTTPKPGWFRDEYEIRSSGDSPRFLGNERLLSGSNMVWRREKLLQIGGFDPRFGMRGSALGLGEESDALAKIQREGGGQTVYYSPDLMVYHWTSEEKMKVSYRLARDFVTGQTGVRRIGSSAPLWRRLGYLLKSVALLFAGATRALVHVFRHERWQNWMVVEWAPAARGLGGILASLGLFIEVPQDDGPQG